MGRRRATSISTWFLVGILAIVIPSIGILAMYDSIEEVISPSEAVTDFLVTTAPSPEEIPSLSEGISETTKSLSHTASIFSNFIQKP